MNVLILVKNSEVGGVLSCTKSLVEGLEQLGHMAVVATCDGEGVEAMLKGKAVNIVNFNTKDPCQMVKNYRTLKLIIEDYKIDVIHAQNRIPALYASIIHFFNRKINYIWANHLVPIPSSFVYRLFTRYGCFAVAEGIEGGRCLSIH